MSRALADLTSPHFFAAMPLQSSGLVGTILNWATLRAAQCEQLAVRWPATFSCLAAGVLMALTLTLLPPSFQTNDDPQLAMIAAGKGLCLRPDEHLIFTNIVIGRLLKALYTAMPAIPWYGCYLYCVHYLSQVALIYCALTALRRQWGFRLYLLYFGVVELFCLNNLQFTVTAFVAAQAGVFVCLVALRSKRLQTSARIWPSLCVGVALMLLGSLVRLECLYLTLVIALPAIAFAIGWPPRRAIWLPAVATAGACAALVFALAAYDSDYYRRDPRWRHFASYNAARIKFNDYGWTSYRPETADLFKRVGWSENDHAMIAWWFYENAELYRESKLRQVIGSYPWRWLRWTPEYYWCAARSMLRDKSLWPMLLTIPFLCWCTGRTRWNLLVASSGFAIAIVLLVALAALNKPPPSRVYFPVLTFAWLLTFALVRRYLRLPRNRWPRLAWRCLAAPATWRRRSVGFVLRPLLVSLISILAIGAAMYSAGRQLRHSGKMAHARRELQHSIATLRPRDDQLYVFWAPGFPYEAISPFDNLERFKDFHLLVMSWPQSTPLHEAMKRKFGVDDLYQAIYQRPDVLLIGDPRCHSLYEKFIREHYGVDVRFAGTFDGGHRYDVAGRFAASEARRVASSVGTGPRASKPNNPQVSPRLRR